MRTFEREEFESGDKVRINATAEALYKKHHPYLVGQIMTVEYQYGEEVRTDRGYFDFEELELVEE